MTDNLLNVSDEGSDEVAAARRQKEAIAVLRSEFARWGLKADDLSDDEIEEGAIRISNVSRDVGISSEQAAHSLRVLMQRLKE